MSAPPAWARPGRWSWRPGRIFETAIRSSAWTLRAIRRCSAACTARPSGRNARSAFFHLGYPEHSARYNPIGRFSRLTEVATRIANQLPSQGNAEAFRQFAWLFTHMVGQALFALGNGRTTARPSST